MPRRIPRSSPSSAPRSTTASPGIARIPTRSTRYSSNISACPIVVLRASPKAPYDNKITTQQVAFWIDAMTKQKLISRPLDPASLIVP